MNSHQRRKARRKRERVRRACEANPKLCTLFRIAEMRAWVGDVEPERPEDHLWFSRESSGVEG